MRGTNSVNLKSRRITPCGDEVWTLPFLARRAPLRILSTLVQAIPIRYRSMEPE
jgi:hypothetical protein